jgi:mannose-6-phosphate isomerase-like protein (cupin superfamily)
MKKVSRRTMAGAGLLAAASPSRDQTTKPALAAHVYSWSDLPVKMNGENRARAIFDGLTHSGFPVELHATELAPGGVPHGVHRHVNEEIVILREGTLEVTIGGERTLAGPGSVVYVSSGVEHGLRNAGSGRAHYYVMALGPKKPA